MKKSSILKKPRGMKLIIGLGNPGPIYENTYHNIGKIFVDYLKNHPELQLDPGLKILKSKTYMNESGNFVAKIAKQYKAKPEEILIVHDDSDIELGKYKISFKKGTAGHKGIHSIIEKLKTKNFYRLRIGIRPPKNKDKASDLVLKKIKAQELNTFRSVFQKILEDLTS